MKQLDALTDLQVAILEVLWDDGAATANEVWERLEPATGLSRKTIGTMLHRLHRQRVIGHRLNGREYVYAARVTREQVRSAGVRSVLQRLFAGDLATLVSHALSADEIEEGDVARLRALLDARAEEGDASGR